jgi:hypothetical protein
MSFNIDNLELSQELGGYYDLLNNVELLEIPSYANKAIADMIRFDLDFGGDSKTAKTLDVIAQELTEMGLIREIETTSDLEDELLRIYQTNKKIKEDVAFAKERINDLYFSQFLKTKFEKILFNLEKFLFLNLFKFNNVVMYKNYKPIKSIFSYLQASFSFVDYLIIKAFYRLNLICLLKYFKLFEVVRL